MGRKKRKVVVPDAEPGIDSVTANSTGSTHVNVVPPPPPPPPPPVDPRMRAKTFLQQKQENVIEAPSSQQTPTKSLANNNSQDDAKKMSSGYATTSHSAEIIEEDIYVSDGSESDEDLMADKLHIMSQQSTSSDDNADDSGNAVTSNIAGRSIEMVLSGSKMGLMRRGIHRPTQLVQPNRQWARQMPQDKDEKPETSGDVADDDDDPAAAEERRKREQEEELAKLDPAQRAARLLAEKQRKLEEAKILARKLESEENAGRDPCLFSKRTSFDIRFDQIDDKPWERGAGDVTDFFNYGFSEEDWLEYAEQQLLIRQELIDANRQKRIPDPSIVPVIPKKPKVQAPRVAVSGSNTEANEEDKSSDGANNNDNKNEDENVPTVLGPLPKKGTSEQVKTEKNASVEGPPSNEGPSSSSNDLPDVAVGVGGAWGLGAAPGSVLAKLIEEQDKQQRQEETQDPTQSEGMSPRKGNNKYENDAPSYYGNGGASESGGGYNDNQPDQQNNHHYGRSNQNSQQDDGSRYNNNEGSRNSRYQNKGGHYDRNNPGNHNNGEWNSRNNDRGQHHQGWNDGGRGGYRGGNRGGSGRRGGGDYGDGKGRKRGNNYSDRNDYQRHKRPREDYDDRYSRR